MTPASPVAPVPAVPKAKPAPPPAVVVAESMTLDTGGRGPLVVSLPEDNASQLVTVVPGLPTVTLLRTHTSSHGTFGVIRVLGKDFESYCLELPWHDNRQSVSCIPKGRYKVLWTYSPRFRRNMYLVDAVPGRTGIRIHSANIAGDVLKGLKTHLNGCIAPGSKLGVLNGQQAVLNSAPTLLKLEALLERKPFTLVVDGVVG